MYEYVAGLQPNQWQVYAELLNAELLNAELLNAENYQTPNITKRRILQIL